MNKKNKTKKIKDDRVNNISWIELVVKYTQKKSGTNAHTKEPKNKLSDFAYSNIFFPIGK